ncbi:DUF1127 domain-containing protein [Neorhizobium lilium]|uniref:DUF1127 domain-containing protein n=1 Tax=Neorhizobium lilium TaxID=2503024 RepID=A0A3S3RSR4_9HYPH|nr:DUF1127 domain-containing protein [Neorhizobium lilium]RWX77100.1 DUF1127 domain-containing protein [Neorhizobium lilium]
MSTANYGSKIDLAHGAPATQGRLSIVIVRTMSVWRALRNRFASNRLYDLDDRQLDDIGITRHDVVVAMERSGVLDDPSLLLSGAARERARTRFSRPPRR